MTRKILPCPHCGGDAYAVKGPVTFSVLCDDCGTHGPCTPEEQEAVDAWNRLPRRLTWQKTPPSVRGHYWYIAPHLGRYGIVFYDGVEGFRSPSGSEGWFFDVTAFSWAGPIPEPKEAKWPHCV